MSLEFSSGPEDIRGKDIPDSSPDSQSEDEEPDSAPKSRVLDEDQDLSQLSPQLRENITIVVRNNSLLEYLVPRLCEVLESHHDCIVNVSPYEQGASRADIQHNLSSRREEFKGSTLITDDTCARAWGLDSSQSEAVGVPILGKTIDTIVNSVIMDYLRGDVSELWRDERLRKAPRDLATHYVELCSVGRSVTTLLESVKENGKSFDSVYLSPRHLLDHPPFFSFFVHVFREYERMRTQSEHVKEVSAFSVDAVSSVREAFQIFIDLDTHPLGSEKRRRAEFPDAAIHELQQTVGDTHGIEIRQPVDYLKQWVERAGVGDHVKVLDAQSAAPWNGMGMTIGQNELFIADRHLGAWPEDIPKNERVRPLSRELHWIKSHESFANGSVMLLPLGDSLTTLRAQKLLRRTEILESAELIDQLAERVVEELTKNRTRLGEED